MPTTLSRPPYWLGIGLEWLAQATAEHAECAFAITPSFIPKGVLSPSAYTIFDLAKAVVPAGEQQVVMFSELTQTLLRHNADWAKVGVPDWEATLDELAEAPVPALYLSLSRYAHVMVCTAGMEHSYVHYPDGRQERIPESDFDDLRNGLRAQLRCWRSAPALVTTPPCWPASSVRRTSPRSRSIRSW
jgi:hypothetical protein